MIFVSGATGYIGGAIARLLAAQGFPVQGGIRAAATLPAGVSPVVTGDLARAAPDLAGATTVIHAAGLGHRRGVAASVWHAANVGAAANLARAAARAGAEHFILISTAHIYGRVHDGTVSDDTPPNPMDDYAASKLQAEQEVAAIFGSALTIIRPVAVVGPRCPGNIPLLIKLIGAGLPLPIGSIRNARSFIHVDDLAHLVAAVVSASAPPAVALAAHPQSISTPDLIRALATGLGKLPRLMPFPKPLLASAARLTGRAAMWQSLAGSFAADPRAAIALGWSPTATLSETLRQTARYYNTTFQSA